MRMFSAAAAALWAVSLIAGASGCTAAPPTPTVAPPKPLPETSAPTPSEPEPEPEPDEYEGWGSLDFAFGHSSVRTPPGALTQVIDNDGTGDHPRWAGGETRVATETNLVVSLSSSTAAAEAIVPTTATCGEEIIEQVEGPEGLAQETYLALFVDRDEQYPYVGIELLRPAEEGLPCGEDSLIPNQAGGYDRAGTMEPIDSGFTAEDAREWFRSDRIQEAVKILRSFESR